MTSKIKTTDPIQWVALILVGEKHLKYAYQNQESNSTSTYHIPQVGRVLL